VLRPSEAAEPVPRKTKGRDKFPSSRSQVWDKEIDINQGFETTLVALSVFWIIASSNLFLTSDRLPLDYHPVIVVLLLSEELNLDQFDLD
jgi:hypothetical protein